MRKTLACLLALTLALALAACGGKPTAEQGAQAQPTSAEAIPESAAFETNADETTASPIETETESGLTETETAADETTAVGSDPAVPSDVPTDTAGILAYFNAALGKTSLRRASFQRTMTKVTAKAAFGLVDEENLQDWRSVQALANADETKSAPSDLVALRPDWVARASSNVSGGTATLTIRLKDHALAAIDPKPGTYGYVSTIDKATAVQMVIDAAIILTDGILTSANVTQALFGLEKGVYTAEIDTQTGKLKSVRFTGTQSAAGEAKCRASIIPVPGNANITLRGDMIATYLPV